MTHPKQGGANTPLERLRALAAGARSKYTHVLAGTTQVPPYAAILTHARKRDLILGYSPSELAALARQAVEKDASTRPLELVDLTTGERRAAVMTVFFAVNAMVLPLLVGNLIDSALADSDLEYASDSELRRASEQIDAGDPVPAGVFPAIADIVELDLEDRRHDDERDMAAEALLGEIHDQLLFRAPARNYAPNAATGT